MVRLTTLALLVAAQAAVAKTGLDIPGVETIALGQDVDYPPYAFQTATGELTGFGKDFADGMNAICAGVHIEVVEERWSNCWTPDGVGAAIVNGTIDGCMTYTHTQGIRDDLADFSIAMLNDNKAAGLLTLLDDTGTPYVDGMDDLAGKKIIDVSGWAPTADGLGYVENKCTGEGYSSDVDLVIADGDVANDVAMRMLRDGEGDAIFLYAEQAAEYLQCPDGAVWNCTLWEGFGTQYAYVQSGQFNYVVNGTTLVLANKGSGIRDKLAPCMGAFMATQEYSDLCVKYNLVGDCYANEFFPAGSNDIPIDAVPTNEQTGDCSDGYCPCDNRSETSGVTSLGVSPALLGALMVLTFLPL